MYSTPAPIVVGVDDGPEARAALHFALREAIRRGSPLDVVTVWTRHKVTDPSDAGNAEESGRARAQEVQDSAVAAVSGDLDLLRVLSRQVVEGDPARVLLRIARNADYLVVGSSRGGRLREALLGSVSRYCIRHATCPVLVVPAGAPHPVVDAPMPPQLVLEIS